MTSRALLHRFLWSLTAAVVVMGAAAGPALAADTGTAVSGEPVADAPDVPGPPGSAPSGQSPATVERRDVSAEAGSAAPAATLSCTLTVGYPRHIGRNVVETVTVSCSAAVRQINIRAGLYKNNRLVKDSGQKSFYNTRTARADAAVTCSSGVYQGYGATGILYPAGYQPPTRSISGFGQAVRITC